MAAMDLSESNRRLFDGEYATDLFMCLFEAAVMKKHASQLESKGMSVYLSHHDLSINKQTTKRPSFATSRPTARRPQTDPTVTIIVLNPQAHWTVCTIDRRSPKAIVTTYHDSLGGSLETSYGDVSADICDVYGIKNRFIEPRLVTQFERPVTTCGIWACFFIARYLQYLCGPDASKPYSLLNDKRFTAIPKRDNPTKEAHAMNWKHIQLCKTIYTEYLNQEVVRDPTFIGIRERDCHYIGCVPRSPPKVAAVAAADIIVLE